jgi:hypothetical protein
MRRWLSLKTMRPNVPHHSDNGKPIVIAASPILAFETFTDCVLARPIAVSRAFIDNCNERGLWAILIQEIAFPASFLPHWHCVWMQVC